MRRIIGLALPLLLLGSPVYGQAVSSGPIIGQSTSISATTGGSTSATLPSNSTQFPAALLFNDGTVETFYSVGSAASSSSAPLPAGSGVCVGVGRQTFVAAITTTSTTTVRITQMTSCPIFSFAGSGTGGGGGGSGGSVTQGTLPWVTSAFAGTLLPQPIYASTLTVSAASGSLISPPGTITAITSNSAAALVTPVNCISGCSGGGATLTATYNQVPATLVSGSTSNLQVDQLGALKVNITSALTSPLAVTTSAAAGSLVPQGIIAGTLTTSGASGTNFVAPIAIGSIPTLTTSAVAGSNFVAPVVIGSAPTLTTSAGAGTLVPIGVVGIGSTVTVSNSAAALITPVNCISGCSSGTTTVAGTYNQVPATLVSGGQSGLQMDQVGSLKVNIVSQLASTLTVSNAVTALVTPVNCISGCAGTTNVSINGTYNQAPATLVSGGTTGLQMDQNGALKVNITSQLAATLTTSVETGALFWPPGPPTGLAQTSITTQITGSLIMGAAQNATTAVISGTTNNLVTDLNGNLKVTAITSNASTALVTPVTCISGCSGGGTITVTGTYNQVPAVLVSGGTNALQVDQSGALKVNITSQLAATLTTSPQSGSVSWPPGTPQGLSPGSATAGQSGSAIMGAVQTSAVAVASGSTAFLSTDLNSNLRVTAITSPSVTSGVTVVNCIAGCASGQTTVATTYNQVPATLVSGGTAGLQSDQLGSLKVNIVSALGSPLSVNTSPTAGTLIWPPGTHAVTGTGTFTTSGASGTLIWPPGTISAITSNSSTALVTAVNCISGCSASTLTGTYNQVPATLASGATYAFQSDQNGALKVNITSQLAATLTVSEQSGALIWPPGPPTGLPNGSITANATGSPVMGNAQTGAVALASGSTNFLATDLNGNLKVNIASAFVTALTVSNSATALVTPVNCISGCSASTLTGTYNQVPATLVSGATYAFQSDQNGALKVNITSALTAPLAVNTSPIAGTLIWPPGTHPVTGVGTFTTSAGAGTLIWPPGTISVITSNSATALVTPVQCLSGCSSNVSVSGTYNQVPATLVSGGTSGLQMDQLGSLKVNIASALTSPLSVTTSAAAGSLVPTGIVGISSTVTVSATSGSNFVAPVAIGSAPTLVTSTSSAALVTPVNCISGCSTATFNGTYNQVPATLVSGGTSGLQLDQVGSLKVNIVSQLAATLTTSPQSGSVSWPPGQPQGLPQGSITANISGSAIMGNAQTGAVAIASGSTNFLATDLNGNLKVNIASAFVTALAVSNASTALVTPVNCISGCSASTLTGTYNQVPATLASGATYAFQSDQNGALKVNIVSALTTTLAVSPSSTSLATITSAQVGSLAPIGIIGISNIVTTKDTVTYNQVPATLVSGGTNVLQADQLGALKVNITSMATGTLVVSQAVGTLLPQPIYAGTLTTSPAAGTLIYPPGLQTTNIAAATTGGCTSSYVTASTSSIINLVKQTAGTLCWMRIVNASAVTATVRAYDTASVNQQAVCGGSIQPVSYDLVQPNSTSPGSVNNQGPFGMAFANGLAICITGSAGGTFPFQDQTSLITNALFVNIGIK